MVAIIGILAAIAVPNYTKFQVKAREAEAKTTLGAIYMSEKAYIQEALGSTNNLLRAGYTPDGSPLFNCGFAMAAETLGNNDPVAAGMLAGVFNESANPIAGGYCGDAMSAPNCMWNPAFAAASTAVAGAVAPGGAVQTFNARCTGFVGGTVAAATTWDIDQANMLTNTTPAF